MSSKLPKAIEQRIFGPVENLEVEMVHKKPEEDQRTNRQIQTEKVVKETETPDGWIQRMIQSRTTVTEQELKKVSAETPNELMEHDVELGIEDGIEHGIE